MWTFKAENTTLIVSTYWFVIVVIISEQSYSYVTLTWRELDDVTMCHLKSWMDSDFLNVSRDIADKKLYCILLIYYAKYHKFSISWSIAIYGECIKCLKMEDLALCKHNKSHEYFLAAFDTRVIKCHLLLYYLNIMPKLQFVHENDCGMCGKYSKWLRDVSACDWLSGRVVVLQVVREAQQQHGLRHGDMQRYRFVLAASTPSYST